MPLVVVGVSLFSVYGVSGHMKHAILDAFLRHMLPQSAESAYQYIDSFISNSRALGLPGMIVLIFLSYSLFNTIQGSFQTIWKKRRRRSFIQNLLVFTNVLFWTPLLMGVSIYLKTKMEFAYHTSLFAEYMMTSLAFLLPWIGFTAAYLIIPPLQVRLRSAALGGVIASILWLALLHGFDIYVKYTQSMQTLSKLYGSLVIIPIFLVWVYFCWIVTFIGAEVASYHQFPRFRFKETGQNEFFTVLAILRSVASKFERGGGGTKETEILQTWPESHKILDKLVDTGILAVTDEEVFLAMPSRKISVENLFQEFVRQEDIGKAYELIDRELSERTLEDFLE